ncbi:uncharacterized protein LOC131143628 [Malania oleifera]|uniref:uncharacterized protein LOC131143628 n=1 Tax=Malania oleifera TaxID=397392 RepID=UPI0025AEB256|nr:uncharacterized protein LOC131143628 [Malania oleifera]
METPLSTKRITRSQAKASANIKSNNSRKVEESEKDVAKSSRQRSGIQQQQQQQQQDRSALLDITNDSPIVGLAVKGGLMETPSSSLAKHRRIKQTPGSGEALLRGQVKTLLQKVEEEAELSKLPIEDGPVPHLKGFILNSPMGLLAPTPANTPNLGMEQCLKGTDTGSSSSLPSPPVVIDEQINIFQVVNGILDGEKQDVLDSQKSLTRSLLMDFSEKLEKSDSSDCSSVLTYQGGLDGESEGREKSPADDENASVWSIQVNASTCDDEEEEGLEQEEYEYFYEGDEEEEEEEDEGDDESELVDELCKGMNKMSVCDEKKFAGKHTRFVYDTDDEIIGREEAGEEESGASSAIGSSPGVLRLKGLPTPKGKHFRFPDGEEEEEEEKMAEEDK